MPESNKDRLRKYIIKELICGIGYNSSNHKLVFNKHHSLSIERMNTLVEAGNKLGLDKWTVQTLYQQISFSTDDVSDTKFTIDSKQNKVGTVYYFECREKYSGNLACLELMKMSASRMLVLLSDDNGLLPGDIINLHNSRFLTEGRIEADVEDAPECDGKRFVSMPISAIRIKSPSLVHEVADMMHSLDISHVDDSEDTKETIDISNPVMGVIMGPHICNLRKYLSISSADRTKSKSNDGVSYKSENGIKWQIDIG